MNLLYRCVLLSLCLVASGASAQTVLPNARDLEPLSVSPDDDPSSDPGELACADCESDFAVSILRSGAAGPNRLRAMVAVSNQGPDDATGVSLELEIILPDETSLDAVDAEPGSRFLEPRWRIERLPVNGSAVLILDFLRDADADAAPAQVVLSARVVEASQIIINGGDDVAVLNTQIGAAGDADTLAAGTTPLNLSPEDTSLPAGTQWERYRSVKLMASGGTPPFRLRLRGTPAGLGYMGLGGTLTLAGTPREAGEFTLVVTLEDSQQPPALLTREYRLEIAEGVSPPPQPLSPLPDASSLPDIPAEQIPLEEQAPTDNPDGDTLEGEDTPSPTSPTSSNTGANPGGGLDASGGLETNAGLDSLADSGLDSATSSNPDLSNTADDSGDTDGPDSEIIDDGNGDTAVGSASLSFRSTLPAARVGQSFEAEVLLGATEDAVLAVNRDLLPPGLDLQADKLLGIPGQAGSYSFSLRGQRQAEQVSRGYTLTVESAPVSITEQTLPSPSVETPYRVRLTALGGRPPYRWQPLTLPSALSLSATGLLSGAIATRTEQRISVEVIDALGRRDRGELLVPGAVNAPAPRQFSIPNLLQGESYRLALPLTGATPPYDCRLDSGALPTGLRLASDCLLLGSPREPGEFSFSVRVADASALPRSHVFPLTLRVRSQTGLDTGIPFRQAPEALRLSVPDNPGRGSFTAMTVDTLGYRTAVGSGVFAGDIDLQLVRYGLDGQFLWAEQLTGVGDDFPQHAAVSPRDRSLWVVGYTRRDNQSRSFIAHFSAEGELLGEVLRPHPDQDSALYRVAADQRGAYVVGMRQQAGQTRGTVLALEPDGTVRWERSAEAGENSALAVALLDCDDLGCDTVVAGGESGESGWLQQLDADTGEVSDEIAVSVAVPVRDLVVLSNTSLAVVSGTPDIPLLILDSELTQQCQADSIRDASLPLLTVDSRDYLYLAGQRPSSGSPLLWIYNGQCEQLLQAALSLPASRLLGSSLGVDKRLSLVGERDARPLAVDLNGGQAF